MTIPVLETARLVLREPRLEDFPAHLAIWTDPRTLRFFGGTRFSEEETWMRFLRNFGLWQLLGYGWWAIEHKESGSYIGVVGLFQAKRPLDIPCRDLPEIGWALAPDFHRQGLGLESVSEALSWADANIDAPESWAMINQENLISHRLAERAGYRKLVVTDYKGSAVNILTRPRGGRA